MIAFDHDRLAAVFFDSWGRADGFGLWSFEFDYW